MYCAFWHAVAKPGKKQDVMDFLRWDIDVANEKESGTIVFDVFDDPEDPHGLYCYEAYVDAAAFAAHSFEQPAQARTARRIGFSDGRGAAFDGGRGGRLVAWRGHQHGRQVVERGVAAQRGAERRPHAARAAR